MMRKLIIASAAITMLALSAAAAGAADQPRPRLKSSVTVTGDIVRIGDLIANAGIVADVPIFRAPDLGTTGVVSAQAVLAAVRAHALVGLDPGNVHEVMVTRASRTIAPEQIEERIAAALSMQYSLGRPKDLALRFDNDLNAVHVEPTVKDEPRIARISYDPRSTRFDAVVAIPSRRPLRLTGHVTAMEEVAMVARTLAHGDVLKQGDVVMTRRPRRETPSDAITDRNRAVGLAARNTLQPGRPLRSADLMKPELVRHHEMVMLIYQVPGIMLTVRGRATEGGAEGDIIGVLNEQTKRIVHGVVIGSGRVMIGTGPTQIAATGIGAQTTGALGKVR
jgi:flagella basal body P-ring formation protein FlgA